MSDKDYEEIHQTPIGELTDYEIKIFMDERRVRS